MHFMANPQLKVEVGALPTTFQNRKTIKAVITCVENGFNVANVSFLDRDIVDIAHIAKGGALNLYVKDAKETAWYTMFKGKIRMVTESLGKSGEKVIVKCDGPGWALPECDVLNEYGNQSLNPTLASVQDIITDASEGIVPAWVNHILGDTTKDSGHNVNTDHVADVGGTIPYIYFGLKPASKCLCDLIDLEQAYMGTLAGAHWIVLPDDILLLQEIAAHDAGSVGHGWSNYICGQSTATALATLVQAGRTKKGDFHDFNFQTLDQLANYIVYYSECYNPATRDLWTENNSVDWACDVASAITDANAAGYVMAGSWSIKPYKLAAGPYSCWYPSTVDLGLNLTALGGKYCIPVLVFWFLRNANSDYLQVWLLSDTTGINAQGDLRGFFCRLKVPTDTDDGATKHPWKQYILPIGPYWYLAKANTSFASDCDPYIPGWVNWRTGDWTNIKAIMFDLNATGNPSYTWIDGMHFAGFILRGAKDGTSITANKLRTRPITDPFAKYDTLLASDDSGTAAQLAKAELLRARTEPMLGTFKTRMVRNALPGQFLHVHARPNWDESTYNINRDVRLTQIVHTIDGTLGGAISDWEVTSDLINSMTRQSYTSMNEMLKAIRPEFQDRQASGIKMRDIDITQAILEKDYFP